MAKKNLDIMTVLAEFVPDMDLGIVARTAAFLDFAAKKLPGTPIAWTFVTKCVIGGGRMPTPDSKNVIDMMRRASNVRTILQRDYGRGLENVSGLGVRATTDADDYANTQLRRDASRYDRAGKKLVSSIANVDPKTMKNKDLRAWVEKDLRLALSSHNERLSQLLLPPGAEGKEGKIPPEKK